MSQDFSHVPVMLDEVLDFFSDIPDGLLLDATVGGGGHAEAVLQAHAGLRLIGLDQDDEALAASAERLAPFGDRVVLVKARFDGIAEVLEQHVSGGQVLAGALFDLGVSSHQLDSAERGFSLAVAGPIDMRMDRSQSRPAADIVNEASEAELAELFFEQGEGRLSRRIAHAIVEARPINDTLELAEVVAAAVPAVARRRGHPARRVFQALRIAVNDELEILEPSLDQAIDALVDGGRIAVLSYHSGEDRIVKATFAERESGGCVCPPGLPCVCGAVGDLRVLTRGARMVSDAEVESNPRARSARLRLAQRIGSGRGGE